MRKIFIVLLACIFLFAVPVVAQRAVQINFQWEQPNIVPDFWGWKMWIGTSPGGPYDYLGKDANDQPIPLFSVQYDPTNPIGPFTGTGSIIAPDNAETTFYFVVNAWDNNGNFSVDSNEVSKTVDFLGPDPPVLTITGTIIVTPQ
jgi:hypothetical protein